MVKKRAVKIKEPKTLKDHIKHKSKLTSLLLIKIFSAFLSLGVGIIAYFFIKEVFNQVISLVIGFAIAVGLYLILVIKVLDVLKF